MKRAVFDPSRDLNAQPAPYQANKAGCHADGCPCRGVVSLGGGPFTCRFHAWADGKDWARITSQLHGHRWFSEFIAEATRLQLYPTQKGRVWVSRAQEFWAEQPDMKPSEREAAHWSEYLWRLREELAFRVGARKDRPETLEARRAQKTPELEAA